MVISCAAHRETRQAALANTWGKEIPDGWEMIVVEGGAQGDATLSDGHLLLPVADDYNHLAEKSFRAIQALLEWVSFEGVLKCDDDTYLHPRRFAGEFDRTILYAGNTRDTLSRPVRYAQGGAYWLNEAACRMLVAQPFASYQSAEWYLGRTRMRKRGERKARLQVSIEDYMVGDILHRHGLKVSHDERFNPNPFPSVYDDPNLFTSHHVNPKTMRRIHLQREWRNHPVRRWLTPFFRLLPASRKPR
jgi:hypothetical protein